MDDAGARLRHPGAAGGPAHSTRPLIALVARALACLLAALAALAVGAGPALADPRDDHRELGPDLPRIVAVEPAVAGLAVTVVEGGLRVRVDNATGSPVRAWPPGSGPDIAPGASAAWADPRLDASLWLLPLRVGDVAVTVSGDRVRPAAPDPVPWWSLTLASTLFTVALGNAAAAQGRYGRGVAGVTLVTVAAHAVHVAGSVPVLAAAPGVGTVLAAAGPGLVCWLLGLAGAVLAATRSPLGVPACAAAGALSAMLTAGNAAGFHDAVLAFGWAYDIDRAATVLTLGCGVGLLVTGVAVLGRAGGRDVARGRGAARKCAGAHRRLIPPPGMLGP